MSHRASIPPLGLTAAATSFLLVFSCLALAFALASLAPMAPATAAGLNPLSYAEIHIEAPTPPAKMVLAQCEAGQCETAGFSESFPTQMTYEGVPAEAYQTVLSPASGASTLVGHTSHIQAQTGVSIMQAAPVVYSANCSAMATPMVACSVQYSRARFANRRPGLFARIRSNREAIRTNRRAQQSAIRGDCR